ncbi:hypothetical protein ACLOJK_019314 [Asimina triloba]
MEDDTAFRIAWPMACASLTVVRSRWPADAASVGICMEIRGQKCRSIARLSIADRPRRGSAMNGQMGFEWQDLMAVDVRFVWAWSRICLPCSNGFRRVYLAGSRGWVGEQLLIIRSGFC